MKRFTVSIIVCAALVTVAASQLLAQTTDAHIQDLIRTAAERSGVTPGLAALQSNTTSPTGQSDTQRSVSLTLDEAIKLALDRNLDISVQRLNPQTFDFSIPV